MLYLSLCYIDIAQFQKTFYTKNRKLINFSHMRFREKNASKNLMRNTKHKKLFHFQYSQTIFFFIKFKFCLAFLYENYLQKKCISVYICNFRFYKVHQ